jgi:hypothetical protein
MDWDLQGPAGLPLDEVRAIREDIARRVNELILQLDQYARHHSTANDAVASLEKPYKWLALAWDVRALVRLLGAHWGP